MARRDLPGAKLPKAEEQRLLNEHLERLRLLLQNGDEQGMVDLMKAWNPGITPSELKEAIMVFRSQRSGKGGI